MKSILKNSNGKAVSTGGKLLGSPEGVNVMKTLLDRRKDASYLFFNYQGTSVDDLISYSDTENVTAVNSMFQQSINLENIPMLNFDNVISSAALYKECNKVMFIPQVNTNENENMVEMFSNCHKLQTIDITSLDKITSTSRISFFAYNCYSLTKLIIRTMTVIPPLNSNSFNRCYHFTGTVNATYNPEGLKDGRIYIPDDKVEELKQETNWSAYADIIVPLSTLVED